MSPRSQLWFKDATRRGVDGITAFIATEMIDGWADYWVHEISDENLEAMTQFALTYPEAALHRWSIIAGPRPWIPDASMLPEIAKNPKYSVVDDLARQRLKNES